MKPAPSPSLVRSVSDRLMASSLLLAAGSLSAQTAAPAPAAPEGVAVMTDIGNYLDFVMTLFLAFGIAFEVPIAVVVLVRMGMVEIATLKEIRSYVIVGAFIAGAILTPPDVISQFMLAVPLWLLYEAGILAAGLIGTKSESYS